MSKLPSSDGKVKGLQDAKEWVDEKLRGKKGRFASTLGVCMRLTRRNQNAALVLHWIWFRHRMAEDRWMRDTIVDIADQVGFPPRAVDRAIQFLKDRRLIESQVSYRNGLKTAKRRPKREVSILLEQTQSEHIREMLIKNPTSVQAAYDQMYAGTSTH
jgi:hypothetical protein